MLVLLLAIEVDVGFIMIFLEEGLGFMGEVAILVVVVVPVVVLLLLLLLLLLEHPLEERLLLGEVDEIMLFDSELIRRSR